MRPIRQDAEAVNASPRLREEIRAELGNAIGLGPREFTGLLETGMEQYQQPVADALNGLKDRTRELWQLLKQASAGDRKKLDERHQSLFAKYGANPAELKMLDETFNQMSSLMGALMLRPQGPYERVLAKLLRTMRDRQEKGSLNDVETAIYQKLRKQQDDLADNPRSQAQDWRAVADLISQYDENVSYIKPSRNVNHPN